MEELGQLASSKCLFLFFASSRSDFKIEYVSSFCSSVLTRGNSESDKSLNRFWIALKRKMTKKDNKALRPVLFITKFTKNLG